MKKIEKVVPLFRYSEMDLSQFTPIHDPRIGDRVYVLSSHDDDDWNIPYGYRTYIDEDHFVYRARIVKLRAHRDYLKVEPVNSAGIPDPWRNVLRAPKIHVLKNVTAAAAAKGTAKASRDVSDTRVSQSA